MHRRSLVLLMAIAAVTAFGFMRVDSVSAQAVQVAPVAHTGGPYTGNTGVPIQFNASLSSGVGLTYQWDFGDLTGATGAIVAHTYTVAGTYTVTLRVTDSFGQSSTATTTATVADGGVSTTCFFSFGSFVCTPSLTGAATISCMQTLVGLVCTRTPANIGVTGSGCVLTSSGLLCVGGVVPRTIAVITDGQRQVFCPVPNISTGCPLQVVP
jgi:hypothetical protein